MTVPTEGEADGPIPILVSCRISVCEYGCPPLSLAESVNDPTQKIPLFAQTGIYSIPFSFSDCARRMRAARFFILFVRPSSLRACASCLPCTAFIFSCRQEPPSSSHPPMHFLILPSCEKFLPSSDPSMRFLHLPFLLNFSSIFSSFPAFSSSYFLQRHFHCQLMHRSIISFTSHPVTNSAGAAKHLLILPSILLVLSCNFSSRHQFCWCCQTSSRPAIISAGAVIYLLILPSILTYIFSSCHQIFLYCHTSSYPALHFLHLFIFSAIQFYNTLHLLCPLPTLKSYRKVF